MTKTLKYQQETTGVYNGSHNAKRSDTANDKQQSITQSCLCFCLFYLCNIVVLCTPVAYMVWLRHIVWNERHG
jgi:hypothetical protein